jgi:hypothetical protein
MAKKEDIFVHGIRFYYDEDSGCYNAQVSPDDIEEVYVTAYEAAIYRLSHNQF